MELHAGTDAEPEDWDLGALKREITQLFALEDADYAAMELDDVPPAEVRDVLWTRIVKKYEEKEQIVPPDIMRRLERDLLLQIVDGQWKDHLYSLDHLKEGIGLRGYGQRDPLVEYKKESFQLFQAMRRRIEEEVVRYLWWIKPVLERTGEPAVARRPEPARQQLTYSGPATSVAEAFPGAASPKLAAEGIGRPPARTGGDDAPIRTVKRDEPKIGRNDPCWCGSRKKFKKCHGA